MKSAFFATAAGNLLVQAKGAGELASLEDARAVVRRLLEVKSYYVLAPSFSQKLFTLSHCVFSRASAERSSGRGLGDVSAF
jgi:hypothetical protein